MIQYALDLGVGVRSPIKRRGMEVTVCIVRQRTASLTVLDDNALLAIGSRDALQEIVNRYQFLIKKSASGCPDREDVEAALTLHVLRKLPRYKPRRGLILGPWLKMVLSNYQIDTARRRKRQSSLEEVQLIEACGPATLEIDLVGLHCEHLSPVELAAVRVLLGDWINESSSAFGVRPRDVKRALPSVRRYLAFRLGDVVPDVAQQLFDLIPAPSPDSINTGLSPANPRTLARLLGEPRQRYTSDCAPVTYRPLADRLLFGHNVGPFKVAGEKFAIASLKEVLADVQAHNESLYNVLGSAGMLCARLVRGSNTIPSNHSWGTAIDITICGKLDPRGDEKVQRGLLALYPYFHKHGWFWGAEFRTEDAMHFELSEQKLAELYGHLRGGVES